MATLLDTCVLVDILRGSLQANAALKALDEPIHVSGMSRLELYAGVRSQREEVRVERLLSLFQDTQATSAVWRTAGQYFRHYEASHGLDLPDAIIASTAEYYGLRVATLNVKHFPMFARLRTAY